MHSTSLISELWHAVLLLLSPWQVLYGKKSILGQMAASFKLLLTVGLCLDLVVNLQALQASSELADHTLIYVETSSKVDNASCWTGGPQHPCNSLELALQGVHSLTANHPWVFLLPGEYDLKSSPYSKFSGPFKDFGLIANGSGDASMKPEASIVCGEDAGFSFSGVEGVTLKNIEFKGCGMVQPSTSRNKLTHGFWEFRVGLYLVSSSDITFEHIWVTNTKGIGALLYSSYGYNQINGCRFYDNSAMFDTQYPAGGGLYIEYSSCIPADVSTCTSLAHDQYRPSTMAINNSLFDSNSAKVHKNITENDYWLLPSGLDHSSIGRGGGLSIVFEGYSSNISVDIRSSQFNSNSALWGGGLFVEFHDNVSDNSLKLENVTFFNNSVEQKATGGGGARLGYIFYQPSRVCNNSMYFHKCRFDSNTARFGGGVSFYAAREPDVLEPTNTLTFSYCGWSTNTAWLGAAVDLTAWQANSVGVPVEVVFSNAVLLNNSILQTDWILLGIGAIYIDSVHARFNGFGLFELNSGTAVAATGASITFSPTSRTTFQSNKGQNGGAVKLVGNSFMIVGDDTRLDFFSNTAEQKGGAIFVETVSKHDLITSPNCFVRYEDITTLPENWTSLITFYDNKANEEDNSIYMTTTTPCKWPGSHSSADKHGALCLPKWVYQHDNGRDNCSSQIKTDPKRFHASSEESIDTVHIYPGQLQTLSLKYNTVDDFDKNATERTVFTASIRELHNRSSVSNDSTSTPSATVPQYITNNSLTMYGKTNNSYSVELFTLDPRVVYTMVQVELLPCPFGFVHAVDNSKQGKNFECKCNDRQNSFNDIIRCYNTDFKSSLNLLGQWAGVNRDTGHRVAGYCPYTETLMLDELTLPPVKNMSDPSDHFCEKINRTDVLCGKCRDGNGPSINSDTYKCVECAPNVEYYSWVLYLCTEILPLTIFFLVLILLNVSLTSGTANAFVFYSQSITTTFGVYYASSGPFHTLRDVYRCVYGIWNLDILSTLPFFQYCLSPNLGTLTIISLEYLIAFYPLLLIIVLYSIIAMYNNRVRPVRFLFKPIHHCSVRLRNTWNPKNTLIDAIAAFILLSYSRIIQTSTKLLRYSALYHADDSVEKRVAYYDGTVTAFGPGHLPFVIVAAIILLIFVVIPPLVLILYPLRSVHFIANHTLGKCCPLGGRFEQFLNAFYGSFKDGAVEGTRDYRSFAGLYLVYRGVFALIRFAALWNETYLLQNMFCLLAFLMFAILKPYRKDMHNTFDACIFALLLLISLLNQYNFNLIYLDADEKISFFLFVVEYILIWIPFVAVVCLLLHWGWRRYGHKIAKKMSNRTSQLEATLSHADIRPTSSSIQDDNSIMLLVDERPQMYNYGSISIPPINKTNQSPRATSSARSSGSAQVSSNGSSGSGTHNSPHKTTD